MIWALRLAPVAIGALLVWYVMDLRDQNEALTAQKAALQAEVKAQATLVASAQNTARLMVLRNISNAEAAHKYGQLREALIQGDFGNEILPDAFISDFVCRLLPATPNCHADRSD